MPECLLKIHVTPRGSKNSIIGWREDVLCVKLTAPPVEGAANALLIKYVAEALGVKKQDVELTSGEKSREKTLRITGLTIQDIHDRLKFA
jgi:uncharacterized protein